MSRADLVVIIACAIAGYWAVSAWLKLRGDRPSRDEENANAGRVRPGNADTHDRANTPPPAARHDDDAVTLSNWYRILGVREDAKREEIAAAYRRKVSEYHPDKVARMGAEIRAVAERKTQQINAAYEMGMRLFR